MDRVQKPMLLSVVHPLQNTLDFHLSQVDDSYMVLLLNWYSNRLLPYSVIPNSNGMNEFMGLSIFCLFLESFLPEYDQCLMIYSEFSLQ